MFCHMCGKEVVPESQFCSYCGVIVVHGHDEADSLDSKPRPDNPVTGSWTTGLFNNEIHPNSVAGAFQKLDKHNTQYSGSSIFDEKSPGDHSLSTKQFAPKIGINISDESFFGFVERNTWWWLFIPISSLCVLGFDSWFLLLLLLPFSIYKVMGWRVNKKSVATLSSPGDSRSYLFSWPRFLIVGAICAVPAFWVSSVGPDHRAYYQDMPIQAAREMGYSDSEAKTMRSEILMLTKKPGGLFLTAAGWYWFLLLWSLYTWRGFLLLQKCKRQ